MSTILVPIDGSHQSMRALPFACELAGGAGDRIVLLEVVPARRAAVLAGVDARPAGQERAESDLRVLVEKLHSVEADVQWVVASDDPARTIVDTAHDRAVDLIVMATHGQSGVGRWVYGSVVDEVLRSTQQPILLVGPSCCEQCPAAAPDFERTVLVALDGSPEAEEAIDPAIAVATVLDARLDLLQVVEPVNYPFERAFAHQTVNGHPRLAAPTRYPDEIARAQRYLEGVAAAARAKGRRVETRALLGFAGSCIPQVASERGVVIVALTTRGGGQAAGRALGTVANLVVRSAHVPVLVVRPRRAVEAAPPGRLVEPAGERARASVEFDRAELVLVERACEQLLGLTGQRAIAEQLETVLGRLRTAKAGLQ